MNTNAKRLDFPVSIAIDSFKMFGIKEGKSGYTKSIKQFCMIGEDYKRVWNDVLRKEIVVDIAKELVNEYNIYTTKVYISKQSLRLSDVQDVMETNIFDNIEDYNGWLVFVNPNCQSNWSHRCEYYFIVSQTNIISKKDCSWFPDDFIKIEPIELMGKN
jgi:hypothetical protein